MFNPRILIYLSLGALILAFQNCAPKDFESTGSGSIAATSQGSSIPATGSETGESTPATTSGSLATGPGTPPTPLVFPQITLKIPTCTNNMNCVVDIVLNRADAKAVSFYWKTDDTKYLSDPSLFAEPNVHYIPVQGLATLEASTTRSTFTIQTLAGFTNIRIPFEWGNCRYGGQPVDCGVFQFSLVAK